MQKEKALLATKRKKAKRAHHEPEREAAPDRAQRPPLPRAEPIRSWSGLFGSAARGTPARVAVDSVQRGVELGYRVIDEYIKQGTAVAGSFAGPSAPRVPGTGDFSEMAERMVKYASDFTSLWFDAMGRVMTEASATGLRNGAAAPVAAANGVGSSSPSRDAAAGSVRLALSVRAHVQVEVLLMLDEAEKTGAEWQVEALRQRGIKAAITAVAITAPPVAGGPVRVSVEVPDEIGPGRYTGAVLDRASGQPRGRLTVVVGP